jgi:prefoldin subunit 5
LIRRALTWLPALAAALLLATLAPFAGAATLKGQVVGATYVDAGRVTVPVLLTDSSAKAGKLDSTLVRLSLPGTAKAGAAGGPVAVAKLRIGDAFRLRVTVPKAARRASYPKLKVKALKLTKRGTIPSVAELSERIDALKAYVDEFASSTGAQIAELRGQVAGVRADLGTLDALVAAVQAAIPGLPADPASTLATLITQVTALQNQMDSLTSQLSGATSNMTAMSAKLDGVGAGDLVGALANIGQLQTLLGGVDVTAVNTQLATLLGNIGGTNASALTAPLATLQTAVSGATSKLNFLCSSAGLVKGNPLLGLLGLSNLTACS